LGQREINRKFLYPERHLFMEKLQTPYFVIDEAVLAGYYQMLENSLRQNWNNYLIGYSFKTNSLPWLVSFVKKKRRSGGSRFRRRISACPPSRL